MGGFKGAKGGKGKGKESGKGKGGGKSTSVPAPPPPAFGLPVGTELTAQYLDGEWYKASVVQVRKKAPEVKVHFNGYDDMDMWVGVDQLRSKLLKGSGSAAAKAAKVEAPKAAAPAAKAVAGLPAIGAKCQVDMDGWGTYHGATVVDLSTAQAKKSTPIKVSVEMWVSQEQLQAVQKIVSAPAAKAKAAAAPAAAKATASASSIPVGTQLTAQAEDGEWYLATVVKLRKGATPVKVHFEGWDASEDRWVALENIRSKLLKAAAKAEPEPAPKKGGGKGKSGGKGKEGGKGKGKGKGYY